MKAAKIMQIKVDRLCTGDDTGSDVQFKIKKVITAEKIPI